MLMTQICCSGWISCWLSPIILGKSLIGKIPYLHWQDPTPFFCVLFCCQNSCPLLVKVLWLVDKLLLVPKENVNKSTRVSHFWGFVLHHIKTIWALLYIILNRAIRYTVYTQFHQALLGMVKMALWECHILQSKKKSIHLIRRLSSSIRGHNNINYYDIYIYILVIIGFTPLLDMSVPKKSYGWWSSFKFIVWWVI